MKKLTYFSMLFVCCISSTFGQSVKSKTFLQGAYQGANLMSTTLNSIIPVAQPYDTIPWNYTGSETVNPVPSNMVDWVLVELREASYPEIITSRRAALLLDNGNVVDVDLSASVNFSGISPGNYYLCIYHRNHIPVMSANPIALPNSIPYDFSDTLNFPPFGGGSKALIELESGIFGMIAGDANKDGTLKYSGPNNDRSSILQYIITESGSTSITTVVTGYSDKDIRMDSIIRYSGPNNDPSIIIQNLVGLSGSTAITTVYSSPVPVVAPPFQCGDSLLDLRDGQKYNTVMIGDHCWFAENLNYGNRIDAVQNMTDNSIPEKHCYNDDELWCDTLGALYQWDEGMQYKTDTGVQGLCPGGWHIPTDNEWKNLEGSVDSQYGVGDTTWNITGWRGFDAGKNLKSTSGWFSGGNGVDLYGFATIPAGRSNNGAYGSMGVMTYFWISNEVDSIKAWSRYLRFDLDNIRRSNFFKTDGRSVRCIEGQAVCTPQPDQANAGSDSINIVDDSISLIGNTPVNGVGLWTIYNGNGGSFADPSNPTTMFYALPDSTYLLVWTISNNCGSSSDTVIISFASSQFVCGDPLNDIRDGQSYNTVQLGNQCWMAENLAYLPSVIPSDSSSNTLPYYYVYDYQGTDVNAAKATANYQTYGALYNWPAAMNGEASSSSVPSGVQGICPTGWHLPSDEEWKILEGEVDSQYGYPDPEWDGAAARGLDAGGNLKEAGYTHWHSPNTGATNSSGFSALPGGQRDGDNGPFRDLGGYAFFWSSTKIYGYYARDRRLSYKNATVNRNNIPKESGFSVRCIESCSPQPTQASAGPDSLNIVEDSITLTANTPVNGQGVWSIFSGAGGSFADSINPTSLFYGLPGKIYNLVWTINNNCGVSTDTVIIGFAAVSPQPCPGIPTFNYGGQSYNTVQIGSQCWMAENLNIGTRIDGENYQANNSTIEKYCYDNLESNCNNYGGLYQWNEMMQYVITPGAQGICPTGWHIPSDDEWKILEGYTDSQYGVGDPEWEGVNTRGFNAGLKLKSISGWNTGGDGTDIYNFNGIPTGFKRVGNGFNQLGNHNYLFTSSSNNSGSQSLKIEGSTDLLYKLGDKTSGQYIVKFYLYFPAGYGGYYNFQHFEAPGVEFAFDCNFQIDGSGYITAAGISTGYTYDHDRWFLVEHKIDLDADIAEFYLDGSLIHSWQYSLQSDGNPGSAILGAVDFFPTVSGGGTALYYVDDINYFDENTPLYWDDFESYSPGNLIADINPSWWTTWSGLPGSAEDAPVVNDQGKTGTYVWYRALSGYNNEVFRMYKFKERGFSVRCILNDCEPQPDQANAGPDLLGVTADSVILAANTPVNGQGLWSVYSGSGSNFADPANPTTMFYGMPGNTYNLVWTISNNCGITYDDVNISFLFNQITANAGQDDTICSGDLHLIGLVASGGLSPYSYLWSNGSSNSSQSVNPTTTMTYTVTVTDANNGTDSDDVTLTVMPLPTADAGPNQSLVCSPVNLAANQAVPPETGLWSIISGTGGIISSPYNPQSNFTGSPGHAYTLRWTITNNCDTTYDDVNISFPFNPTTANAGQDTTEACSLYKLNANEAISGVGSWSIISGNGGNILHASNHTSNFSGEPGECYVLQWKIYTTCATSRDTVRVCFSKIADAGPDDTICEGDSIVIENHASGGIPPYTYAWSNNTTDASQYVKPVSTTTYTLSVTDARECEQTDKVKIVVNPAPIANAGADATINTGSSQTIGFIGQGGDPPYSYYWSTGETQHTITVNPTTTNSYVQSVTDENGCIDSDTVVITVVTNCQLQASASGGGIICVNTSQSLGVQGSLGAEPYSYWWSNHKSSQFQTVSPASTTTYTVTITDALGCTASDNVSVVVYQLPTVNAGPDTNNACSPYTLQGNDPGGNSGIWTIISGSGGEITSPSNHDSPFKGSPGTSYELEWKITSLCGSSFDTVIISFILGPDTANAGNDQNNRCDSTELEGNNPYPFKGIWTIENGNGGRIADSTLYNSWFYGLAGEEYTLDWTIYDTVCQKNSVDSVKLIFLPEPTVPDAGADQNSIIGTSTTLDGNQAVVGNGQWIVVDDTTGHITNPTDEKSLFSGMADSTYILVWQITLCDTLQDSVKIVLGHDTIVPCPGTPTVTDADSNVYNTVLIGTQCWMRENLKVGKMIDGTYFGAPSAEIPTDNDTIEKYCLYNSLDSCESYGGYFYTWDEMMGYDTTRGIKGICPYGWHIPTDEEWKILEGEVDSQYGVGDSIWDQAGYRGSDVAYGLKSTGNSQWFWTLNDGTNSSGFTALPAGYHPAGFGFQTMHSEAWFWTSTRQTYGGSNESLYRHIFQNWEGLFRGAQERHYSLSVRCLKNCEPQPSSPDAGPDTLNIVADSIKLMANSPQIGTGSWTIISGKNGSFEDNSDPTSIFYGESGRYYTLRWTISTICFDSIDEVNLRFINPPCPGDSILNYQGRTYKTVLIGDKCWMAENLNVGIMINDQNEQTDNDTIEKYCYDNLQAYCDIYGGLYQWDEMMNFEDTATWGICPFGWYLPSDQEWTDLQGRVDDLYDIGDPEWAGMGPHGSDVGDNLKEVGTLHWLPPNEEATNASGFAALPGGLRQSFGGYDHYEEDAYFWSSTTSSYSFLKWARVLSYDRATVNRDDYNEGSGFSVRCIRDKCQPMPSQAFAGNDSLDIAADTLVLYADTPLSGNGVWTIVTGTGGSFSDSTDPTAIFYGINANNYILRWTISTICRFDYDEVMIGFASASAPPCPGIPSFSYGGQTYSTVLIDSQCWMKENLNVGTMITTSTTPSDNGQIEKYCYANIASNCAVYGALYQWEEVMQYVTTPGSQGICPTGWHIPDDDDWDDLVNFLGGSTNAGGKMKETGTIHWDPPNTGATNESGFTALPAGEIQAYSNTSANKAKLTRFWSSNSLYGIMANYRILEHNTASISEIQGILISGYSVRCLKD